MFARSTKPDVDVTRRLLMSFQITCGTIFFFSCGLQIHQQSKKLLQVLGTNSCRYSSAHWAVEHSEVVGSYYSISDSILVIWPKIWNPWRIFWVTELQPWKFDQISWSVMPAVLSLSIEDLERKKKTKNSACFFLLQEFREYIPCGYWYQSLSLGSAKQASVMAFKPILGIYSFAWEWVYADEYHTVNISIARYGGIRASRLT